MAFLLSFLLAFLLLSNFKRVSAGYDKWTDLPYCAQDCLTKSVNNSLLGCADISLDCFCQSNDAAAYFNFCLAAEPPCDSDPYNTDVEDFESDIFCNPSADSGFNLTVVKGTQTVTLGSASGGDEASTSSNSYEEQQTASSSSTSSSHTSGSSSNSTSATTSNSSSTSLATETTPSLMTSTSTVVVELSSSTSSSGTASSTASSTSTGPPVTTVVVTAAASGDIMHILEFGSGLVTVWVLIFTPYIFNWL